ncbi:MAG: class I mannose-6-phosphate isomerase [Paludibacteraceae bacterium]|nr:class I mannose-6-phosphate isomerase [Paludibacteraceae bacterium]
MNLYPLKFKPILKPKIWGEESWQLSAQGDDISIVENGYLQDNDLNDLVEVYMGELVGDHVYEKYGNQFPLLFKFITTHDNLSVQVHPDDDKAWEKHHSFGKDEMWYVVNCKKDAQLILGLAEDTNKEQLMEHLANKNFNNLLNKVVVKKGDVAFVPAGLVHALREEVFVAEIQESSDITYRIHDYDRVDKDGNRRELHIQSALEVMDFKKHDNALINYQEKSNGAVNLVECEHFTTNLINFNRTIQRDYAPLDSFVVYMCVEGQANILCDDGEVEIKTGETVLLPASTEDLTLIPKTKQVKLLEIYIA